MQREFALPPQLSWHPMSLHIGIECDKGGAGRVISELMTNLPATGFGARTLVANPPRSGGFAPGTVTSFAPGNASLMRRLHAARSSIRATLERVRPDVVASHFAMYAAPALDLLRGRLNISHFHGPWCDESLQEGEGRLAARAKSQLEGAVYRRADRVIVLSNAFAELVIRRFGVDPARIRLVPGSVDIKRFNLMTSREDSRLALDLPANRPILVTVRRLVHRMGLATLLDAMTKVARAFPEILLCIAGEGPLRSSLEAHVSRLGLARNVRFLGFVTEHALPHLYHAADINVVPSMALEGFGLVAAEALATGTPSMVTPVGGLPEVVSGLSSDLVFPGTGAADIAEALIAALAGSVPLPDRADCREYVRNTFSSCLMARRTAHVYRELMEQG